VARDVEARVGGIEMAPLILCAKMRKGPRCAADILGVGMRSLSRIDTGVCRRLLA